MNLTDMMNIDEYEKKWFEIKKPIPQEKLDTLDDETIEWLESIKTEFKYWTTVHIGSDFYVNEDVFNNHWLIKEGYIGERKSPLEGE